MAPNLKPSSPIDYPPLPSLPEEEDLHDQPQHDEEENTSTEEELEDGEDVLNEGEQVTLQVLKDLAKVDDECDAPLIVKEIITYANASGFSAVNEERVKKKLRLVEPSKREEMENQWKELHELESQLSLKRFHLLYEHLSTMWDAQCASRSN